MSAGVATVTKREISSAAIVIGVMGLSGLSHTASAGLLVVVPPLYAHTDAPGSHTLPLNTGSRIEEIIIDNALLASIGILPGSMLQGLGFRANASEASSPAMAFSSYDIKLGVAALSAASASPTFANNVVGGNAGFTTVRSGALSLAAGYFPTGGSPNAFGAPIVFSTPYYYSGAGNGLVVEITHAAGSASLFMDAYGFTSVSGITSFNATSATATADTGPPAGGGNQASVNTTIIAFDVPEPASWTVMGLGLLGLSGVRARRMAR